MSREHDLDIRGSQRGERHRSEMYIQDTESILRIRTASGSGRWQRYIVVSMIASYKSVTRKLSEKEYCRLKCMSVVIRELDHLLVVSINTKWIRTACVLEDSRVLIDDLTRMSAKCVDLEE